jgi:hypothetical protein
MSESTILTRETATHCVAIMPCSPFKVIMHGSDKHNDGQGTLTLVDYNDHLYGVTNDHVVRPDGKQLMDDFLVVLKNHTFIRRKPIFTSNSQDIQFPFDIAIFDLEDMRDEFVAYGKKGISLTGAKLDQDELFLVVGFPGQLRETREGGVMAHSLTHINITCRGYSETNITAFNAADELEEVERIDFGGVSGGPLFKVLDDEIPDYELVGICYEGRGTKPEGDDITDVDPHGDIWVFGFPLNQKIFSEMLTR